MTREMFIFSNRAGPRLSRHLAFWAVFVIYLFLFRFYLKNFQEIFEWNTYIARAKSILLFLPLAVGYAYLSLYFLLPKYILKGKYGKLFILVCILSVLLLLISHLISPAVDIRTVWDVPTIRDASLRELDFAFHNVIVFPLTVSGFAIGIRIAKDWFLKQRESAQLEKLKLKTELRLQKTQLHPRFLFHSLNIIHAELLKSSASSPSMILKLSHILSYLLYETEGDRVPLAKEMDIVVNYIELARSGFGPNFRLKLNTGPMAAFYTISPLILLPLLEFIFFVENTDEPVVLFVDATLEENQFSFLIRLLAPPVSRQNLFRNIENLDAVKHRLQNQYTGNYSLDIQNHSQEMNMSLLLQLERETAPISKIVAV